MLMSIFRRIMLGGGIDIDTLPDTQKLYYQATSKVTPKKDSLGVAVIANKWDATTGEGVIVCNHDIDTISDRAFNNSEALTSITIPNNITSIGEQAFYNCDNLKEFKGKFATEDGRSLVMGNKIIAYAYASDTTYTIPDSVTEIGNYTFDGCTNLTSITIPNSVTVFGHYAFRDCTGELIVNCNIPSTTDSSDGAFYRSDFTKVTIGDSVTSIGYWAFFDCNSLESIVVAEGNPVYDSREGCNAIIETTTNTLIQGCKTTVISNSVTKIKEYAFDGCTSLESITIPESVIEIGSSAFGNCSGRLTINSKIVETDYTYNNCPSSNWLQNSKFTELILGDNIEKIGERAFSQCNTLTSVTIPNSITSIGNDAFLRCTSLTSVTIPDSVTTIGEAAFSRCDSLTSVTIPNSVTTIGTSAFYYCESMTSVIIGNSVTSIGSGAFSYCKSLTNLTIPDSVTTIEDRAFHECTSLINIIIPDSVTTIGYRAFFYCTSLTSITIPNSVTSIGEEAFSCCISLTSIIVSDGNSVYDSRENCNAIIKTATNELAIGCSSTIIPEGVTSIGEDAFRGCDSLTSVTIPDSVTSIGKYAFYECDGLVSITIPNSVTEIGVWAFAYCNSLRYCDFSTHEFVPKLGSAAFFSTSFKIIVPDALYDECIVAEEWNKYTDRIIKKSDWDAQQVSE